MAYGLKYTYSFKSFANDDCQVDFYFDGYTGSVNRLNAGLRPFVLREYNSDNDIFKPIRPFQAEMEILSDKVTTEDFLANSDDAIKVQFLFNGSIFWVGWLIQDDFQENWIDTNHYITLRATDGLGEIGRDSLSEPSGTFTMLDYLSNCVENTSIGSGVLVKTIVNNLFYDGMQDRTDGNFTPLNQVSVDVRTFKGDNKLTILEKINKAWSMTVYQWSGRWFWARIEEWFTNLPIKGLNLGLITNSAFTKTYEVAIGVGEAIKPIMPEMLKTIRRAFKNTKITMLYENPEELVCNQNFLRGTLRIPTVNTYTIECWDNYKNLQRTLAGNATYYRVQEQDAFGVNTDSYLEILFENSSKWQNFIVSKPINLNYNDVIEVSFDSRLSKNETAWGQFVMYITFETFTGLKYTLDANGVWWETNNYTQNTKAISQYWAQDEGERTNQWKNTSVKSQPCPLSGLLYLNFVYPIDSNVNFKNLEINLTQNSRLKGIIGDYDQYTLSENILQNYEEQTYLDDLENTQTKGSLLFNNLVTGDNWYRMDFPTERLTFKREKAIAHMEMNRRLRRYLQVNMLGNTWDDGGIKRPIWLQNKFIFTDDAPTKKWMIVNLSEMDFSTTEWKAQLIEVWDSEIDSNDPEDYPPHSYGNIFE